MSFTLLKNFSYAELDSQKLWKMYQHTERMANSYIHYYINVCQRCYPEYGPLGLHVHHSPNYAPPTNYIAKNTSVDDLASSINEPLETPVTLRRIYVLTSASPSFFVTAFYHCIHFSLREKGWSEYIPRYYWKKKEERNVNTEPCSTSQGLSF